MKQIFSLLPVSGINSHFSAEFGAGLCIPDGDGEIGHGGGLKYYELQDRKGEGENGIGKIQELHLYTFDNNSQILN